MLRIITGLLVLIACSVPAFAQAAKGVDKQNERVRDSGSDRTPANNGNKTDVGAGRGIDFGRGKSTEAPPLPNPYRLSGRRDVILTAVQDLMRDESSSSMNLLQESPTASLSVSHLLYERCSSCTG